MKLSKRLLALGLAFALLLALAACGKTDAPVTTDPAVTTEAPAEYTGETIKVTAIKGPTGMGMV